MESLMPRPACCLGGHRFQETIGILHGCERVVFASPQWASRMSVNLVRSNSLRIEGQSHIHSWAELLKLLRSVAAKLRGREIRPGCVLLRNPTATLSMTASACTPKAMCNSPT